MLFVGGKTPVANPATAILTENKRFPLVWDKLATQLPTWRKILPETRDPRDAPWAGSDDWILKTAFCNTGDTVCMRELVNPSQWRKAARWARWLPGNWIAQRRFTATPIDSPAGPIFPCVGVYVINGKSAGIYGRYAAKPLIDFSAVDVAVLIEDETAPSRRVEAE
jgi:hypothetical protein